MDLQLGMGGGMEGGGDLHLLMLGRLEQHPAGLWWESFVAGAERGAHRLTETPGVGYHRDLPLLQQLLCSCLLCSHFDIIF